MGYFKIWSSSRWTRLSPLIERKPQAKSAITLKEEREKETAWSWFSTSFYQQPKRGERERRRRRNQPVSPPASPHWVFSSSLSLSLLSRAKNTTWPRSQGKKRRLKKKILRGRKNFSLLSRSPKHKPEKKGRYLSKAIYSCVSGQVTASASSLHWMQQHALTEHLTISVDRLIWCS